MEPNSWDRKPTTEDLKQKKLELEIERLEKEVRGPRILRPGYLGVLLFILILLVSYLYLDRSGFFEREGQTLASQKEELRADVRDFEAIKEGLTAAVATLQEREEDLTRTIGSVQGEYETEISDLRNRVQRERAILAEAIDQREDVVNSFKRMQINYTNDAVAHTAFLVYTAYLSKKLNRNLGTFQADLDSSKLFSRSYERLTQYEDSLADGYYDRVAACQTKHIFFDEKELPLGGEEMDRRMQEFRGCLLAWALENG